MPNVLRRNLWMAGFCFVSAGQGGARVRAAVTPAANGEPVCARRNPPKRFLSVDEDVGGAVLKIEQSRRLFSTLQDRSDCRFHGGDIPDLSVDGVVVYLR